MASKKGMATGVEVARISVKVSPDTKQFRRSLKNDLDGIEKSMQAVIDVDPDMDGFRQKVKASTKGLSAKVDLDVDRGMLDRISSALSGAGAGPGGIGGLGGSGGGLASTGALVAAIAAAAAPAVGLVGSLIAGLPSLATGFGVTAGAVVLGLDGIKKSAETLKTPLDDLKASVSGVFESRFTPIFDQLRSVFPVLKTGMADVANGISDVFQSVTSAVTSAGGLGQLQNILTQTGSFLTSLQPVVGSFTTSFLTLANSGANSFGLLTGSLSTFATEFGDMVNRITSSGAFESAMGGLSTTLDSVLNLFNRLMESGVNAMGQLGGPLATLINGLGDAFIAAMPALTSFSAAVGEVLGQALSALAPVITALTPPFTQFMSVFTEGVTGQLQMLAPVLTQVATALGGALTTAISTLAPRVPELVANFSQLAQTVGPLLAGALERITPALPAIVNGLVSMSQVAVGVVNAVAQVATKLQEFQQTADAAIKGVLIVFQELPGQITSAVSGFGSLLVEAGKNLIQGLINGIKSMVGSAIAAVKDVAGSITGAIKGALGIHSPSRVFEEIGNFTGQGFALGLDNGFAPVLDQAKNIAGQIAAAFSSGADPTALLAGLSKQDIDRMEKTLGLENKRLESQAKALDYQAKISGDKSLSARADEIRQQKDQIGLQKQMLDLTQDYSDTLADTGDNPLAKAAGDLLNEPVAFAKATAGQFMSDLGISGNGIISKGLTEGIKYVFNVANIDDALAAKGREESKAAIAAGLRR